TQSLNINFGARYDFMQPMHNDKKDLSVFRPGTTATYIAFQGVDISNVYDPDYANISPRLGFSYQPSWSKGMVLRGGEGLFFDMPNANPFLDNRPGNSAPNGLEGNPGGTNPVFTLTTEASERSPALSVPCEEIIPTETLSCAINPCGVFSVDKNFRSPYNVNYNLQIERQVGKAFF